MSTDDDSNLDAALLLRHEVRRPLTYLVSCLDWVRREVERNDDPSFAPLRSFIQQACASAEHIADVVAEGHQLDDPPSSSCDLSAALRATLQVVDAELRRRAELSLALSESMVAIDEARTRRLLLNLIVNAMVMLPPDGAQRPRMAITVVQAGGYAMLELRHGGRLPFEAQLASVSAPYFTSDRGALHLGWAICKRIVHACGGSLVVERDESGTRVRVVLPLAGGR
jgi:signal transduction histidine kinase